MSHGDAFFLVARDVMWFVIWVLPPSVCFVAGLAEASEVDESVSSFLILLGFASYMFVSFLLLDWGGGKI